jgi:hypothetical protein
VADAVVVDGADPVDHLRWWVMDGPGDTGERRFRFAERRRAGLFGTLGWSMLIPLAATFTVAWLAVSGLVPLLAAAPVVAIGLALAFGRVHGRPLHAVLPSLLAFGWRRLRLRHRWWRPVPLVTDGNVPVALPPPLAGLALYEIDVAWPNPGRSTPMAVIHDHGGHTLTAVTRVHGDGQFSLIDPADQEVRVDGWGAALGWFARERSTVVRVAWKHWAAPVPVADQIDALRARWADEPETPARSSYLALMETVAPKVSDHDLLVELTVAVPQGRRGRSGAGLGSAISTLSAELELFCRRVEAAGLQVAGVLSAAEVIYAMRGRSDPSALEQLATLRQSLAAAVGAAAPTFGPFYVAEELTTVRVDRSLHRSWWFARWPRREVPADWLDRLLFEGGCTRTVTVVFEPVSPSRSDHAVDRELVKREANIESRHRRGFRVTGKDRKALGEAEAREAELNAGFAELSYVGLVALTAAEPEALETQAARLEQTAAQVGVELQPLLGQQAAGWVASLPLGRTVAQPLLPT